MTLLCSSAASRCRNAEILPPAGADDRGGQGVLHGAGVEDAHDVAGPGRRERGEERPVQPILAVELDDLRTKSRNSRCARVTRGADGKIRFFACKIRTTDDPMTIEARLSYLYYHYDVCTRKCM